MVHPIQQHAGHSFQTLRQGRQTLDRVSNGAVDYEQHLIDHLTLLELPLNLTQAHLIIHQSLKYNKKTFRILVIDDAIYDMCNTHLRQGLLIIVPCKDTKKGSVEDGDWIWYIPSRFSLTSSLL